VPGLPQGSVDTCQGDSGGQLVWRNGETGRVLMGVAYIGEGCARSLKYGIYTRASAYRVWIDKFMAADRNS